MIESIEAKTKPLDVEMIMDHHIKIELNGDNWSKRSELVPPQLIRDSYRLNYTSSKDEYWFKVGKQELKFDLIRVMSVQEENDMLKTKIKELEEQLKSK